MDTGSDTQAEGPVSALRQVPAPRRNLRSITIAVMVITASAALLLAATIYPEARFAFEGDAPLDLGQFDRAPLGPSSSGRYVKARVELGDKPRVSYRRPGEAERHLALAGDRPRFVEYALPRDVGARFVPPRLVAGRLARVGELGLRFRGLAPHLDAIAANAGATGWVIVDGQEPNACDWAVAMEVVLLGIIVFNVASIAHIVKRKSSALA